jgi:ubiquinone/menaquinone biosynthesis C-methylase UbiE
VINLWDERAKLGNKAGTQDRIAKELEIRAISKYIQDGMTVLDVGCGDGETAAILAGRYNITIDGFDSSETMIKQALNRALDISFSVGDIIKSGLRHLDERYDLVYTERCLINLLSWKEQKQAINNIAKLLKPGGLYVMCENSQDGLDYINGLRAEVELPAIEPPAHNRYLRDEEIEASGIKWIWAEASMLLDASDDYSSTYYYLSRVINAALATQRGEEPDYDSPINRLALSLPPIPGMRGQGRIWLWRRPLE